MTTSWDHQLNQIRKQLGELQSAIANNAQSLEQQQENLQDAQRALQHLLESPSNARAALFELPLVLGSLNDQQLIGALLLSKEGKIVMHHSSGQRLLGIDPATNRFPTGCYFDFETGDAIPDTDLPWTKCLNNGQAVSMRLVTRGPESSEDLHLDIICIPFSQSAEVGGVVTLFHDISETVKADRFMRKLCHKLELQLHSVETAQKELLILAGRLGIPTNAWDPPEKITAALERKMKETAMSQGISTTPIRTSPPVVLVVDDIPVNQQLLTMQLKKLGVSTQTANNGKEASSLCAKNEYTLVFMDLDMPILNGFDATAEIRQREKARGIGRHVPIVAMTSYDREGDREQCLKAGMDDYLAKGVAKQRLADIVNHYVFGEKAVSAPQAESPPAPKVPHKLDAQLDMAFLEETFGEQWNEVTALFFGSASTLINCLEFAIEEKDPKAVNHFAFSLKGPCATIGLTSMSQLAATITADAESGNWEEAIQHYKMLRKLYAHVKDEAGSLALPKFA